MVCWLGSVFGTDPTAEGVRLGCPGDACTVSCHDAGDKDGDHGPPAIPVGSQPALVRVLCSRSSRSTLLLALNGEIMGTVGDAADLVVTIRGLTILLTLPLHLTPSIYVGACGHVYIHIDDGRIIRPLLRWPMDIKCGPTKVDSLLLEGRLRYLDAAESCTHDICVDPCNPDADRTYTMSEIHAILMLGITAGCIPLLHCPDASVPRRMHRPAQSVAPQRLPRSPPKKVWWVSLWPSDVHGAAIGWCPTAPWSV